MTDGTDEQSTSTAPPIDPRARSGPTTEESSLDYGAGSGSLDRAEGWTVNNSREPSNDGRSNTNTTFYSWETHDPERRGQQLDRKPRDRRGWDKLAQWNDGVGLPSRSQDNFEADVRRWTEAFSSTLDLTPHQQERSIHIADNVDLTLFRPARISSEKVILGVISLVVDKDTTDFDNWIIYRDSFQQLMGDVGLDMDTLWKIRRKLQEETDFFSV